jgi:hypothetical protein
VVTEENFTLCRGKRKRSTGSCGVVCKSPSCKSFIHARVCGGWRAHVGCNMCTNSASSPHQLVKQTQKCRVGRQEVMNQVAGTQTARTQAAMKKMKNAAMREGAIEQAAKQDSMHPRPGSKTLSTLNSSYKKGRKLVRAKLKYKRKLTR